MRYNISVHEYYIEFLVKSQQKTQKIFHFLKKEEIKQCAKSVEGGCVRRIVPILSQKQKIPSIVRHAVRSSPRVTVFIKRTDFRTVKAVWTLQTPKR